MRALLLATLALTLSGCPFSVYHVNRIRSLREADSASELRLRLRIEALVARLPWAQEP